MPLATAAIVAAGDAALASQYNALVLDLLNCGGDYATAGGSSGAFTLTLHSYITAYTTGMSIALKTNHTPTGSCTVNVNSLGAKTIKKRTSSGLSNLAAGDVTSGDILVLRYDGTYFQVVGGIAGAAAHNIIWTGAQYGDSGSGEMQYGSCALVNSGKRWIGCSATATAIRYYNRLDSKMPFSRDSTDVTAPTITPTVFTRYMDGATEYCIGAAYGGTTIYRYDTLGANETAFTPSGASIVGVRRMGWDGTYLYVQDDATNSAGTAVKRFTVSGTTLTYVDTITLGTAPSNTIGTCRQIVITATHLAFIDVATSSSQTIRTYLLNGTAVDNLAYGFPHPIGLVHKWDDPTKHYVITFSNTTADNEALRIMVPFEYGT